MAVDDSAVGKSYPAHPYEIGKEKIAEFARVVGEENHVYFERSAARQAGFRDIAAPPMFAVVYSSEAIAEALFDSEVGIDFARLVHASQEFHWGEPVCCGDLISTEVNVAEIKEKAGNGFYTFESVSRNGENAEVVRGTWTNIVRAA